MIFKKVLILVLAFCLFFPCAKAEEEKKSIWNSIGGWFSQAWDDSSAWVSQAWKDATTWVSNAWGDSSKWVSQAWNDSSTWAANIWGDVSTWVSEKYDSASAWWIQTFNSVSEQEANTWEWIDKEAQAKHILLTQKYYEILTSVQEASSDTENKISALYDELLAQLNLNRSDSIKVMDTIKAYAEEKGISVLSLEKIMLPYLAQLTEDSKKTGNSKIPPIAVAQYLTGVIEKTGLKTEEQAKQLIESLDKTLATE